MQKTPDQTKLLWIWFHLEPGVNVSCCRDVPLIPKLQAVAEALEASC